ncbi:MAG: outer membrane protein assembly factor BamA [Rhodospirillaceae bacterium]|nr:outer membrane protein assembly factor BamA [Rhodospirillaceae bacterium]
MFRWMLLMLIAIPLLTGAVVGPAEAQSIDNRLRDIRVEGAQRIEADTVRSYMGIRRGDQINAGVLDKSLKALFATGMFADVNMRQVGRDVVVRVVENPIVNRIAFEGNKRISNEILNDEVKLRPRVVFTRARVQTDLQRIMDLYRRSGRFSAAVIPKVIQLPQNRVDLVFEISEGALTEIRKIAFVGNKHFEDGELREIIQTRETAWYRFLSSDDTYDPDRLTFDRELLRRHYLANGYADFRIVSAIAELIPDKSAFFVTFVVEEGKRYKFGKIDITTALKNLDAAELSDEQSIETGDWYNADEVEGLIGKLTDVIGVLGYAFVDIRPRVRRDRKARTIDVTFVVQEGPRVFVELLKISGNVRTVDKVIRREVMLIEGDAFNTSKLRRTRQRIRNLGFFERVEIENKAGSGRDKTIIDVSVKERSTGEISFGAGFSSSSGVLGDISIRERNLLGRGQDLRLGLQVGERQQQIDLSFTEPYFLDKSFSAGLDIFSKSSDLQSESSFDHQTIGFALRGGYRVTETLSQTWRYTLREDEIKDVASDASLAIKEQEGAFITSSIGQSLLYDQRDSRLNPTEGYFVEIKNTVAGLGGDSEYIRNELSGDKYYQIYERWILNMGAGVGYVFGLGEDIRIIDRFFLGGKSLRGFDDAGVGPRDRASGDSVGGNWFYRTTVGLTFPLGLPNEFGVRGRIFTDAGSLGENDSNFATLTDTASMRMSVGTGLLWDSPFGPVNIDFAKALLKEDFDETELVRFSFGARF